MEVSFTHTANTISEFEDLLFSLNLEYVIKSIISKGSFGTVYEIMSPEKKSYAAKLVDIEKTNKENDILNSEYMILQKLSNELGFPCVKDFATKNKKGLIIISL